MHIDLRKINFVKECDCGADPCPYGGLHVSRKSYQGVSPFDAKVPNETTEYTGGSVSYYKVRIEHPTSPDNQPYTAECNDIIEALGMNYAEGNAFKAIWRRAAASHLNLMKTGYTDGLYDAEKIVFFGERLVSQEKNK